MLECLIVGDSIAVGVSQVRTECHSHSVSGINSANWNKKFGAKPLDAQTVIISLGSNDYRGIETDTEIRRLRERVKANRVFWILPAIKPHIQATVRKVARDNGDTVLEIKGLSTDGVHPTGHGYKQLAEATMR